MNEWDPLRVKDEPGAADGYSDCVAGLYQRLVSGASESEIAAHLVELETQLWGQAAGRVTDRLPVARSLKALRIGVRDGLAT